MDMKAIILGLVLAILAGSPALAQYFIVPGGGLLPDGSVRPSIPVGVPFTPHNPAWHGAYAAYSPYLGSPVYLISYPYVPVPVGSPRQQPK